MHSTWKAGGKNTGEVAQDAGKIDARQQLFECIQENAASLLGTIRAYVLNFGLATGADVQSVAAEILQETVIEALSHVDAYVVTRQPTAWLLGIAINMIRRRRAALAKQERRELSFSRLIVQHPEISDESELLEQLIPASGNGPEQEIEMREQVAALLALVPAEDQHIIRLALLEDFKRAGLAARLGISPNAARMRLHRALERLRAALISQESPSAIENRQSSTEGGERHV